MIITQFSHLRRVYHDLGPGDLFIGQIPGTQLKGAMLLDLAARGVRLLPSATAQCLSASKVAQAFILQPWMLPHTRVITRRKSLLEAVAAYQQQGITAAVTKQEHLHCGQGVRKWDDLEMLYSCLSMAEDQLPFVMQPFVEVAADLRIIRVGDYCEAYTRRNPLGFRKNLAAGGSSRAYRLSDEQRDFCDRIMARGQMPYAHIDLLITESGALHLSEISLNGGLRGARMAQSALEQLKRRHLEHLAADVACAATGDFPGAAWGKAGADPSAAKEDRIH